MAQQPANQGQQTVLPYIGCGISLISKSGIRYEGILCQIDTKESTVQLQNVRSFGSEGRRKTGNEIPPSNNVYEFIVFRGSDIERLQVLKGVPRYLMTQMPNDPAILSMHPGNMAQQQQQQHAGYMQPWMNPYYVNAYYNQQYLNHQRQLRQQQQAPAPAQAQAQAQVQVQGQGPAQAHTVGSQPQGVASTKRANSQADHSSAQQKKKKNQPTNDSASSGTPKPPTAWGNVNSGSAPRAKSGVRRRDRRKEPFTKNDSVRNPRNETASRDVNTNVSPERATSHQPHTSAEETLNEFDFELSNSLFDKEKEIEELKEKGEVESTKAYDSKSSFFDHLSCESLKQERERKSMVQQRKKDVETFGAAGNRRPPRHNRNNYKRYKNTGHYQRKTKQVFKPKKKNSDHTQ
eukprot:TRINITY_DN3489_c0_g1_i1.p1 TRINITY_DN3489_c0_g1~~TRINITY_DN3489_c0_g1_i1.p1  ORF type:complete len:414 (-),score=78.32 TRINITY_DN3489_c0_g1_i1:75-1289(-)